MKPLRLPAAAVLALLLCLGGGSGAATQPFAAPAEGPVAFRRDLVPLDADSLGQLSRETAILACTLAPETAEERRGLAQMLAIALALDPANTAAREHLDALSDGVTPEVVPPSPEDVARAKVRIWQLLAWLETPEAGEQGQALAACLQDVMNLADPEHPRAIAARGRGERGTWAGWIPEIADYMEPELPSEMASGEQPVPVEEAKLKLAAAAVTVPLWVVEPSSKTRILAPVAVRLGDGERPLVTPVESIDQNPRRRRPDRHGDLELELTSDQFSFEFPADQATTPFREFLATLEDALELVHGPLPPVSVPISIGDGAPYLFSTNGEAAHGAAFVLASAGLTGDEPVGTILGKVTADGKFVTFPRFWDHLRALIKSGSGRLVVPADAIDHFAALLALEQPDFFLRYEVIAAGSVRELLECSAKTPPAALADASAKFHEIRTKSNVSAVNVYAANHAVRQRVAEIVQIAPNHVSARMLGIQGAGERPLVISGPILASELRRSLGPMEWMTAGEVRRGLFPQELADKIEPTYEKCRAEIDLLERYVDSADRPLFVKTRDLVNAIRTLGRSYRLRAGSPNGAQTVAVEQENLLVTYETILAELSAAAGDPQDQPEPQE